MDKQFIRVIENSLDTSLCDEIVNIFENSPNLQAGRTGGGIDETKKKSTDVSIQRHSEFKPIFQKVNDAASKHLVQYFKDYFFALIGPISLTLRDPQSQMPVALTAENFDSLGAPKIKELVNYLFRLGEINAQRYRKNEGGYPYWHSEIYQPKPYTEIYSSCFI